MALLCKCGCGNELTGNKTDWSSEACRARGRRKRAKGDTPDGRGQENLSRIASLLSDNGIDPADIGALDKVRLNEWEVVTKDIDGNPQVTKATAASLILSPAWESGPQWPVVQPAKPVNVKVTGRGKKDDSEWKTCVLLPDPQIGYRMLNDGSFDPFHDEAAIDVALQIITDTQPEKIINLGDLLDFAQFGRFAQEPSFAMTTQKALDTAHEFLAKQRAIVPDAEIKYLEGNHDKRLQTFILQNAMAAFNMRQAATPPDTWPVNSVPHLLRLEDLDVEYIEGYPQNRVFINERVAASHGPKKYSSARSSAALSVDDERVSVIVGHTHRIELAHKTRAVHKGFKQNFVACIGCLCRTDGTVPSTKGSISAFGRPVVAYEDWQNGIGVLTYKEGDGDFHLDIIPIISGKAIFRGKQYATTI